jgi:CMP-N-acetylneuraminic acid synthetase
MKYGNIYYIVPARMGSKGFPLKNRTLIKYAYPKLIELAYDNGKENVIISTDDDVIDKRYGDKFLIHGRSNGSASDTASMKDVLKDIVKDYNLNPYDILVTLYLTYPQRKKKDIQTAIDYFISNGCRSLLCKKAVKTHPYLCIYENGKQVIKHNLYRRQDYPEVFEISHFMSITQVKELKNLNNNLYNNNTFFKLIEEKIDVDSKEDLINFENSAMHITGR